MTLQITTDPASKPTSVRVHALHGPPSMHEAAATPPPASSFTRRLLHRWLIEYNPLYLLSAMLVLGGMILSSRGLAREGSLYGQIGVAAIAELYAAALIGGAAFLTRIGQRRPAVMLALLTVLYQCDLTLHTEACANLGALGVWASIGWLALFLSKLGALAWAVNLRFSSAALATATLGAVGMTFFPHVLDRMDPSRATLLVGAWLFALTVVQRFATVTSLVDLDSWGATVLSRAVRATWVLWASLLVLHVAFWTLHYRIQTGTLLFVAPLAATRWVRRESRIWVVAIASLLLVALDAHSFSTVSILVAAMLGVRSWMAARSIDVHAEAATATQQPVSSPYRFSPQDEDGETAPVLTIAMASIVDGLPASRRFLAGALFATYLSVWTLGWKYGPWPSHILPLDLALTAFVAFGVWKMRARIALAPLAAAYIHFVWHARLIPLPHTTIGWGGASVGLGFLLLVASIVATYWLKRTESKGASIAAHDPMS